MRQSAGWFAIASVVLVTLAPARGAAQALEDNDFNIDAVPGPVLGSSRIVGLGGAHTALAAGIDTVPWNPAGYAARKHHELDWFEWGIDLSVFVPGSFGKNDFYNNQLGKGFGVERFTFFDLGLRLQFAQLGIGLEGRGQLYTVPRPDGDVDISVVTLHYGAGWMFLDGQLVVGAGLRTVFFDIGLADDGETLAGFTDTGFELGAVFGLEGQPWRLGVAGRTPVEGRPRQGEDTMGDGVRKAAGFVLPNSVRLPWELQIGAAVQLGPRPLNRRWAPLEGDPEQKEELAAQRERAYEALPRRYWLLTADLLLVGSTPRGIGIDAFIDQQRRRAGERVSVGFRVGAETEAIPGWLKVRAGSYVEPGRNVGIAPRIHGTFGFDARLFTWDLFGLVDDFTLRAGAVVDGARDWIDFGLTLGFWH